MGMFDSVKCAAKLPGEVPSFITPNTLFQTKSLDCIMTTYTINADGKLHYENYYADPDSDGYKDSTGDIGVIVKPSDHTGEIEFYASNISGAGPGLYTKNGEDAESVTYVAVFSMGTLVKIDQTEYKREPALPVKRLHETHDIPTKEERQLAHEKSEQSLIGQTLFVESHRFIKTDARRIDGYFATVVAEDSKQYCLKRDDDGVLELRGRYQLDSGLWFTIEEAIADKEKRNALWNAAQAEYDQYVEEWHRKRQ